MTFQQGQQVGSYIISNAIGRGGMAMVYRARHARLDRTVAIKVLHANYADDNDFLRRFQREAQVVSDLDHPNIVMLHDYDTFDGQPYLVMKYVQGRTLKDIMAERTLSLDEIVRLMTDIADALTYAHKHGVLHRDVKPGNIIVEDGPNSTLGTPYLTDFGLARVVQQGESTMSFGKIVGTPYYLSPEQGNGKEDVGPAADVYALGVLLYELVVGKVPFDGKTAHGIIHDHIYTPPPKPSRVNSNVPSEVEAVLLRALRKKPADRYQSPNALMKDFRAAVDGSGFRSLAALQSGADPSASQLRAMLDDESKDDVDDLRELVSKEKDPIAIAARDLGKTLGDVGRAVGPVVAQTIEQAQNVIQGVIKNKEDQPYRPPTLEETETIIRRRAGRRLRARRIFTGHLTAFVVINAGLMVVWGGISDIAAAAIADDTRNGTELLQAADQFFATRSLAGIAPALYDDLVAVVAVQQNWIILLTFLWAGALLSHWFILRSGSVRAEQRKQTLIENQIRNTHGDEWQHTIMQSDYERVSRKVEGQFRRRLGFYAHLAWFLAVNIGLLVTWSLIGEILQVVAAADGTPFLAAVAEFPMPLIVTVIWLIFLLPHSFATITGNVDALDREIEKERSALTQRPASRDEKRKAKQGGQQGGVRLSEDGEITESFLEEISGAPPKRARH